MEGDHGGVAYAEWDHVNQNTNWSGLSKAPAANNSDKQILTDWYVLGVNYMFNRDWGVAWRMPFAARSFLTDTDGMGDLARYHSSGAGDLEIVGMYTGFSNDMSKGIMAGLKLPTGVYTAPGFDRDTQLGTGSTDIILGGFWRGMITGDNAWQFFSQIKYRQAIATKATFEDMGMGMGGMMADYKPGSQADGAIGIAYNNWYNVGPFDKITPVFQVIGTHRQPDSGMAAMPDASGYDRILIAPGIEFTKVLDEERSKAFKLHTEVEIPVYERMNGNQLVSPYMLKIVGAVVF
jgi:hypothetical protein